MHDLGKLLELGLTLQLLAVNALRGGSSAAGAADCLLQKLVSLPPGERTRATPNTLLAVLLDQPQLQEPEAECRRGVLVLF